MKKLFLKIIVLSLALSNLSFNEAKAVDLSVTDKAIIGVFGAIGLTAMVLAKKYYNNYQRNVEDFYKEFDTTFDTSEVNEKIFSSLPSEIPNKERAKTIAKIKDVIKSLRTSMGKDIIHLTTLSLDKPFTSEQFIENTNNALKKAVKNKFKEIKEDINFTDVLTKGFETGKYSQYLTKYLSGSEEPLSQADDPGLVKLGRSSLPTGLGKDEDYTGVSSSSLLFQETEQQRELASSSLPTSLAPSYGEESYLQEHSYEEPAFVPRGLKGF